MREETYVTIVTSTLRSGSSEAAGQLAGLVPPLGMVRGRIAILLNNADPMVRAIGLSRLTMELGYGANPRLGACIGNAVLSLWAEDVEYLSAATEANKAITLLTVVRATARAHLLLGQFELCISLVDRWLVGERFLSLGEHFVSGRLLKVEALARQLKIVEARSAWNEFTPEMLKLVPNASIVQNLIAPYYAELFEPAAIFDYGQALRKAVAEPHAQNRETVRAWKHSWAESLPTPHLQEWVNEHFHVLDEELNNIDEILARPNLSDGRRYDEAMRSLFRFGNAARTILRGGIEPAEIDLNSVNQRIDYAATVATLEHLTDEDISTSLRATSEAKEWCRATGDHHDLLNALQAQRVILDRAGRGREAFDETLALFEELRRLRRNGGPLEVRAAMSTIFHRVLFDVCRFADQFGEQTPAFSAIEFRRGLSTLERHRQIRHSESKQDAADSFTPNFLGPSTHYLGLTAFRESDFIAALLCCADGTVAFSWVPITPATIREMAQALDPAEWITTKRWFQRPKADPRRPLASLLAPVEKAFVEGRIVEGDHLCVSADDPIHAVPLQCLPLFGGPAVTRLSFCRVTSLADARQIVESEIHRPTNACLVFIPALLEKNAAERLASVLKQREALANVGPLPELIQGRVDGNLLLNALGRHELVHIQAHGRFRSELDPLFSAGILVSEGGDLALRGTESPVLLTPNGILQSSGVRPGAHISLSACVSGLGRRALGGDTIGMEFALRLRGASSVIASHCDVTWESAATFFASFYHHWLGTGASRAQAWRRAILDQASNVTVPSEADLAIARASAFSLFGDWR